MGFYYGRDDGAPAEEKPPGCLETLLITRAVFGILLWPLLGLALVFLDLAIIVWAFVVHPAVTLIPVALTGAGLWLFARWEQRRFRPPGL